MLITTEKKHWLNGYQTRAGGKFKTFALSLGNYAVCICWGSCFGYFKNGFGIYKRPTIYFYKLI